MEIHLIKRATAHFPRGDVNRLTPEKDESTGNSSANNKNGRINQSRRTRIRHDSPDKGGRLTGRIRSRRTAALSWSHRIRRRKKAWENYTLDIQDLATAGSVAALLRSDAEAWLGRPCRFLGLRFRVLLCSLRELWIAPHRRAGEARSAALGTRSDTLDTESLRTLARVCT